MRCWIKLEKKRAWRNRPWDAEKTFVVPAEAAEQFGKAKAKGKELQDKWDKLFENYKKQYPELAKLITNSKANSIVGGGDTLAAIKDKSLLGKFSFVSTGGGAMLEFLAQGTLPGIEALE